MLVCLLLLVTSMALVKFSDPRLSTGHIFCEVAIVNGLNGSVLSCFLCPSVLFILNRIFCDLLTTQRTFVKSYCRPRILLNPIIFFSLSFSRCFKFLFSSLNYLSKVSSSKLATLLEFRLMFHNQLLLELGAF